MVIWGQPGPVKHLAGEMVGTDIMNVLTRRPEDGN